VSTFSNKSSAALPIFLRSSSFANKRSSASAAAAMSRGRRIFVQSLSLKLRSVT